MAFQTFPINGNLPKLQTPFNGYLQAKPLNGGGYAPEYNPPASISASNSYSQSMFSAVSNSSATTLLPDYSKLPPPPNAQEFARFLSQASWMRFSVVAQPDFASIAKDPRFGAFIGRISAFTLNTVSQQIHQELIQSVNQIVSNLATSFDQRIAQVQSAIMNELSTVDAELMATSKDFLSHDMFDTIFAGLGKVGNNVYPVADPNPPVEVPKENGDAAPVEVTPPEDVPAPVEENPQPVETEDQPAAPEESVPEPPIDTPQPTDPVAEDPPPVPEVTEPPQPTEEPIPVEPPVEPVEPPVEPEVIEPEPEPEPPVPAPSPLLNANWVWSHESDSMSSSTSPTSRPFRYTLNTASPVNSFNIDIAADRCYTLYVNGLLVGMGNTWNVPDQYTVNLPETSKVVIAVYVVQDSGTGWCRVAAKGKVWNSSDEGSTTRTFTTDTDWKSLCDNQLQVQCGGDSVTPAFIDPDFNDAEWEGVNVQASISESDGIQPSKAGGTPFERLQNLGAFPDAPSASNADVVPPLPA